MSESKHTPGPWRIDHDPGDGWHKWRVYGPDPGGFLVANLIDGTHLDADANARLMAASPDLLSALQSALKWCPGCRGEGEISVREYDAASGCMEDGGRSVACRHCKDARAAIRKATNTKEG